MLFSPMPHKTTSTPKLPCMQGCSAFLHGNMPQQTFFRCALEFFISHPVKGCVQLPSPPPPSLE